MRIAEQVTFGGSALNRAAELRGNPGAIAAQLADAHARALPIWRGKPLLTGEALDLPGWLPLDHAVFAQAGRPVFLGLDDTGPRFAFDISAWEPEEAPDTLGAFFDPSQQRHPALPGDHVFAELRGAMTRMTPRAAELVATAKAVLSWHHTHGACAKCGAPTEMTMAGWQRDCPTCGAHHFPRTDPVVIMLILRGNSVLMGRSPHWPEGMYSLLAGFVEPGETIEAAVRREVFEESGIRVGTVDYLSSQPWPFPASLMFGCRGDALSAEIEVDTNEIEDAIWVSREEMMDVFAGNSTRLKPARRGAIAHFLIWNWLADRLD
ncbi:NAD(+) diphosphatase [Psychromarinibacter sp. C21-152]|uniref:NAD(+) diphosphatase n=1 Tax=Psychromarinibacter sediminicola TaxID=3033385 RepID=A0AAE3NUE1_9RHOB|nr:NAD(+) diphosphatase [Psychromarinibacter sediminicola]MDF0600767.1 NAD(+) diphosphatase [Psychromarinibacter sediminicola]